jgi:superfamily II DNA/RNA helicase
LIFSIPPLRTEHENIKQQILYVENYTKDQTLLNPIFSMPPQRTLVFVNSKAMVSLDTKQQIVYAKDSSKNQALFDLIFSRLRQRSTHENIMEQIVCVEDSTRDQTLLDLIFSMPPQRPIVFVNSKDKCEMVNEWLYSNLGKLVAEHI